MGTQRLTTAEVEVLRQEPKYIYITTGGVETLRQEPNINRITALSVEILHRAPRKPNPHHGRRTGMSFARSRSN